MDLYSGRVSKQNADRGEFSDFSFVAADYITHTATDPTEDNLSSWSISEEEEIFEWPFVNRTLPFSAVYQIVRYLTISDIATASQVCKSWHKFLWTNIHEIDLSTISSPIFEKYWSSHICKILMRPSRLLKLRMNKSCTDDAVGKIPTIIPLESLSFSGCCDISRHAITNLLKENTKKTAMRPKKLKFPMLAELDISDCTSIDDSSLDQISRTLPLLKQLNVAFSNNITDSGLTNLYRLQSLWRLDLQGLKKLSDSGIQHLVELPNLRVLDLTGCVNLTNTGVESLRTKAKQLEVLIWETKTRNTNDDEAPEKANKGFAGLFSKKGSLFKVSRGSGSENPSQKPPTRLKASKNFLPSFKRKKTSNLKLTFSHRKTNSSDDPHTVNFAPNYANNVDDVDDDIPLSPRSRGAKKRDKKKEKVKDRKGKKDKKNSELAHSGNAVNIPTREHTTPVDSKDNVVLSPRSQKKKSKPDRAKTTPNSAAPEVKQDEKRKNEGLLYFHTSNNFLNQSRYKSMILSKNI